MGNSTTRKLTPQEHLLITHLLSLTKDDKTNFIIPETVKALSDGEMGSIRFVTGDNRVHNRDLVQVKYADIDNVLVLITLTVDNQNELFELEFWKVDFNKLKVYPRPDQVAV